MPKKLIFKKILAIAIIVLTLTVIAVYYIKNPVVFDQLKQTPPYVVALLFGLYLAFIISLAIINDATLKLCKKPIEANESIKVTMYSSFINFFGPLQSGPAFRAVYFKKLHGVEFKKFTLATIVYYICYALISGVFLLASYVSWILLPVAIGLLLAVVVIIKKAPRQLKQFKLLSLNFLPYMALATMLQLTLQALIYYFELKSLVPNLNILQVLAYTGAANFALFVSITPGALGFREAFLLFSEKIHQIDANAIIVATTLDRAVYVLVLITIGVYIIGSNIQKQFGGLNQTVN